jgi:hypothetical protein
MTQEFHPSILNEFLNASYSAEHSLVIWRPLGVFDDALGDRIVDFIEAQELDFAHAFNRFASLDAITDVQVSFGYTFKITERRRERYTGPAVKSALFCSWPIGYGLARTYEALMEGARIHVRSFRKIDECAAWLGVPVALLGPVANPRRSGEEASRTKPDDPRQP